ncbi:MAG: DUF2281 domain-containing protein [Candidatus Brocadiales bacterium]
MLKTSLKKKLIADIETLPEKKVKEVIDFIEYLKLKELKASSGDLLLTNPFIDFVNKRGRLAKTERKAGRKFTKLEELQKEYK